jgi:aspartyl-tRNA(Asn)/glutamyl-tRNA(Gln) amidotransferase subunit C
MSVDQATVRRVAKLARIKVKEENVDRLAGELNSILHWIEQLNEVDVAGIEPLTSVVTVKMRLRKDEVTDGNNPKAATANAPASDDDYFMVPKVIE